MGGMSVGVAVGRMDVGVIVGWMGAGVGPGVLHPVGRDVTSIRMIACRYSF